MTVEADHDDFLRGFVNYSDYFPIKREKGQPSKAHARCLDCDYTFASAEEPRSLDYVRNHARRHTESSGHNCQMISIRVVTFRRMTQEEQKAYQERWRGHGRYDY